jgi:hypothetical protein
MAADCASSVERGGVTGLRAGNELGVFLAVNVITGGRASKLSKQSYLATVPAFCCSIAQSPRFNLSSPAF